MKNKTTVVLSLVIAVLICICIVLYTSKPTVSNDTAKIQYQNTIDSLDTIISKYKHNQIELDKKIANYELDIKRLDFEIDSAKNKIIEIRNSYGEKIKIVGRYSTGELDDFFSNRYE